MCLQKYKETCIQVINKRDFLNNIAMLLDFERILSDNFCIIKKNNYLCIA